MFGITAYGALKRLADRPRQRNLLLIGLGGVGMMGLAFAQAMFKQKISVADLSPAARETALKNGAAVAYDPSEADIIKRIIKENDGGFDAVVDFAGNEKSMNFAVSTVARGGKIVVRPDGRQFQPADGTVDLQAHDHRRLHGRYARGGAGVDGAGAYRQDQPTPITEKPMGDAQKWIEQLRAGKVVGRIVIQELTRFSRSPQPPNGNRAAKPRHLRARCPFHAR